MDVLSLENSLSRARTLVAIAQAAARLLEVVDLEHRVRELEAGLGSREVAR